MKTIIGLILVFCAFSQLSFAGPGDDRKICKGTILNYTVKEVAVSYKLKATVIECNRGGNIKIQWQTTGAKLIRGICRDGSEDR